MVSTFSDVVKGIDSLHAELEKRSRSGKLVFSEIRQLMKARESSAFVYRPKVPLDVEVGDVGFMKEDGFVTLDNVRNQLKFEFACTKAPLTLTCSGGCTVGTPDETGVTM
jgi:hypothetical protein